MAGASFRRATGGADEHDLTAACGYGSGALRFRRTPRSPHSGRAQVATGSIVGTVVDSSGQLVPGAQVTVREVNRNTTTTLVTDAAGVYTAPFLVPGTYEVAVELQGFKSWIRRAIVLQVNDRVRIDAKLEVGTVTESTTVMAESPLVRTDSSEVGTVIEERAIKELPLNGRNFAALVYLAPGITPGQAGENLSGASTFNPRGASNFNALGQPGQLQRLARSTASTTTSTPSTPSSSRPRSSRCASSRCCTGVFSAEFGRGAGVVSVSTKSGTQRAPWHGLRVPPQRRVRRAQLLRPQGARAPTARSSRIRCRRSTAISSAARSAAPLVIPGLYDGHNRTFFFADYSGIEGDARRDVRQHRADRGDAQRRLQQLSRPQRQPDPDLRSARRTRLDAPGRRDRARSSFPSNIIPQDRINPVGRNIASIYPLPNTGRGNFNNYISTPNREITDNAFSGRVDHRLSDNDSFFVRFNYGKFKLDAPQGQADCCLPTPAEAAARFDLGPFVAGIQNTRLTTHGAAFNYTKVLGRRSSTSSASATPARAVHDPVRLRPQRRRRRSASRASTSTRSRPACRTSTSRTSPASPAGRRSCRSTRSSSTIRSRTRWCGSRAGTS